MKRKYVENIFNIKKLETKELALYSALDMILRF